MATLDTLEKEPFEERIFSFDFAPKMASEATISSIVSLDVVNQHQVQGSQDVTYSGATGAQQQVQAKFIGGTSGEKYKVTCKVIDSDGQKLEAEGYLKVKEI